MYNASIKVLNKIIENGFEAYIVGGYPRDIYLARKSSDVDICTNATPKDIKNIFNNVILPTHEYGSVTVIYKKIRFEITTYRKDLKYINNRVPSKVKYTDDLFEDLRRRDFTVNTLCMNERGEILDVLNIKEDFDNKVIRTVGDAKNKISEDSLRILRAVRFSTILNFDLDKDLKKAIKKYGYLLKKLSYFRKKEELDRIFASQNKKKGIDLINELDLSKYLELDFTDVILTPSTINIWAQLNVDDIYSFTNNEKEVIKKIKEIKDTELGNEFDRIEELEKKELEDYYSEYKMRHTNPKHAIVEQETEMMEDMTEGQLAEYLAENFNDY